MIAARRLLAAATLLLAAAGAAAAQADAQADARAEAAILAIREAGLPPGAALALEGLVLEIRPGFVPRGLSAAELESEAVCAKAVSRLFWSAFGGEDDLETARGVSGDAWMMSRNVRFFGGESFPWTEASEAELRPGDILGLHYSLSVYNDRPKPVDYTHLALVLAVAPGRGALLAHAWNPPAALLPPGAARPWPLRLETLGELRSAFPGLFEVREVIRPRDTSRRL